jgi:hypothetical protein
VELQAKTGSLLNTSSKDDVTLKEHENTLSKEVSNRIEYHLLFIQHQTTHF